VRFYRIGDKVVSREKVDEVVSAILEAREGGATQEEVRVKGSKKSPSGVKE
jgi:hypothetical protein